MCLLYLFWQLTGQTVGKVKAVADMHQRKAEMAKHSDAFIALPGLSQITINSFSLFRATNDSLIGLMAS